MKLKFLHLKNFLSHEETKLDFEGLNGGVVIYGENGAGKSALIDGILYALYSITSRGKDDALIKNGKNKMNVELCFEFEGKTYLIRKEKEKGKSKRSELFEIGEYERIIASGEKVDDFIENLLNLSYNSFTSTYFLLQNNAYKFILATPSERFKILFDLLDLNRFEEYKKEVSLLKRGAERDIDLYKTKISEIKEIIKEKDVVLKELAKIEEDIQKEKILREKLEVLERKREVLREKFLERERYKRELSEIDIDYEDLLKKERLIEEKIKKLAVTEEELLKIKEKGEEIKRRREEIERELRKIEAELSKSEKEAELERKILFDIKRKSNLLESVPCKGNENCFLLKDAKEAKNLLPIKENFIKQIKEKITYLKKSKEKYEEEFLFVKQEEEELRKRETGIFVRLKEKERLMQELGRIKDLKLKYAEAERIKKYLIETSFVEDELRKVEKEIVEIKSNLKEHLEEERNNLVLKLKLIEEKEKEKEEIEKILKEREKELKIYECLIDVYVNLPRIIFLNYVSLLEEKMNEVLREISEYQVVFSLDKKTKSAIKELGTLDIIVVNLDGERKIESLSGGEKTRVALASVIGLSSLLGKKKIKTLVIDEPSFLDIKGYEDFITVINHFLENKYFESVFIISHDERIINYFDKKIKISKKEGKSVANVEDNEKNNKEDFLQKLNKFNLDFNINLARRFHLL